MLADAFSKNFPLHSLTRATHSCILAQGNQILFFCEDTGRHHAIDKALGYALLNDIYLTNCMIFTSGRVSLDMVKKVAAAKIPVVVSKTVPTAQAISLGYKNGLTIIGQATTDSYKLFN